MATEYMNVNLHWFDNFDEEQIGRLVKAATQYAFCGENTVFEGEERFVWPLIKQALDAAFCGNCTEEIGGNKTVTEDRFDTTDELIRQNKTQDSHGILDGYTSFTQNTGGIFRSWTNTSQNPHGILEYEECGIEKERELPLEKDIPPAPPIERDNPIEKERDSTIERKKSIKRKKETPTDLDADFDRFWECYPRKVNKKTAQTAFAKVMQRGIPLETLLTALEKQKRTEQWTRDKGKYIPHASTWLHQDRWEDEVEGGANDGFGSSGTGRTEWGLAKSPLECV